MAKDGISAEIFIDDRKATAVLNRFVGKLEAAEKKIEGFGGKSGGGNSGTSFAGGAQEQLRRATEIQNRFRQTQESLRNEGGGFGTGFLGGVAAGLTDNILPAIKSVLNASASADDSMRLLQATAKETGISFQTLEGQAKSFGEATAQSNGDAQRTFAQIVNFANAAGRSDKIEEFRKRFADLAAAKGINAGQLGDIARQLNALTDEATDKLLNANPSAFYEKFAQSIGKTAGQLSDAEKRAAVFDEVLKKGGLFTGEAEKRLQGFGGQVDQLNAKLENLRATIGKILQGPALALLSGFQLDMPAPTDAETARILAERKAKELADGLRLSDEKINAARKNPFASLENFALSQVNLAEGFSDPQKREAAIANAIASATKYRDDLQKRLELALSSGNSGIAALANKEFRQNINLFDLETREKFIQQFSSGISAGFQEAITAAEKNVPKLREILSQINRSPDLTARDRGNLSRTLGGQIEQLVEEGKQQVRQYKAEVEGLLGTLGRQRGAANPFYAVFDEGAEAIRKATELTRGLDTATRAAILNQTQAINNVRLYSTRLTNAFNAVDLQAEARVLREPTRGERHEALETELARMGAWFDKSGELQVSGNRNIAAIGDYALKRTAEIEGHEAELARRTLDEKLRLAASARTPEERAAADRAIISATSGDMATFTDAQRSAAALARENEATRLVNAEAEAKEYRRQNLVLQERVAVATEGLLQKAEKGGSGAIKILLQDDTKAGATAAKNPARPQNDNNDLQLEVLRLQNGL